MPPETPTYCTSTVADDSVLVEGETFTMTCAVNYTGDSGWAPKITWTDPEGFIYDVIDETSGKAVKVSVERVAESTMDGYVYNATTHFGRYNGTLPPGSATNVPSYNHTHTYQPITVHCEYCAPNTQ